MPQIVKMLDDQAAPVSCHAHANIIAKNSFFVVISTQSWILNLLPSYAY